MRDTIKIHDNNLAYEINNAQLTNYCKKQKVKDFRKTNKKIVKTPHQICEIVRNCPNRIKYKGNSTYFCKNNSPCTHQQQPHPILNLCWRQNK